MADNEQAQIQDQPLKETGDPLEEQDLSEPTEAAELERLSSVEKLVLHGRHMGF